MSYDISLRDPITGDQIQLDTPHHMRGGTYAVGGSWTAYLNITYNYATHYDRILGKGGIRSIYGLTGAESIPVLQAAAAQLGDDVDDNYLKATEGNAKAVLLQLIALAQMCPHGVWGGD